MLMLYNILIKNTLFRSYSQSGLRGGAVGAKRTRITTLPADQGLPDPCPPDRTT